MDIVSPLMKESWKYVVVDVESFPAESGTSLEENFDWNPEALRNQAFQAIINKFHPDITLLNQERTAASETSQQSMDMHIR